MANLKDLLVNGPSNLIGDVTVNKIRLTSLEVNNGTNYDPGSNGQVLKSNGTSVYWANDNNTTSFTITANATDGLWDLTGTNGTNSVTYALAPYSSKQTTASFYTGTTAPSLSTRLNYDGYLYAKKLYSDGAETITKNGGTINNSLTLQKSSTSADSPELIFNGQTGNSEAYKWSIQKNSSGALIFSKINSNNTSTTTIVFSADGYLLPNITNTYDLGSNNNKWANVYATNFKGNADTATTLSNTLSINKGGTNNTSFTNNSLIYYKDNQLKSIPDVLYQNNGILKIGNDDSVGSDMVEVYGNMFIDGLITPPLYAERNYDEDVKYDLGYSGGYEWDNVYANNFIGDLTGNADTATSLSTSGTTAQFWRGDNTWSNILTQNQDSTISLSNSNSKIGTAIRTLHIATAGSTSGSGLSNGVVAGITFGSSDQARGGIYYQASNTYGSRLYFATTSSFADGAYARMVIRQDGKVGIGVLDPDSLLHIKNGDLKVDNGQLTIKGTSSSPASSVFNSSQLILYDSGSDVVGLELQRQTDNSGINSWQIINDNNTLKFKTGANSYNIEIITATSNNITTKKPLTVNSVSTAGTNSTPIYWNNGTPMAISSPIGVSLGGTGNSAFSANTLIYTSNAATLSSGNGLYTTGSNLAINKTSITNGFSFEVNGDSLFHDDVSIEGNLDVIQDTHLQGNLLASEEINLEYKLKTIDSIAQITDTTNNITTSENEYHIYTLAPKQIVTSWNNSNNSKYIEISLPSGINQTTIGFWIDFYSSIGIGSFCCYGEIPASNGEWKNCQVFSLGNITITQFPVQFCRHNNQYKIIIGDGTYDIVNNINNKNFIIRDVVTYNTNPLGYDLFSNLEISSQLLRTFPTGNITTDQCFYSPSIGDTPDYIYRITAINRDSQLTIFSSQTPFYYFDRNGNNICTANSNYYEYETFGSLIQDREYLIKFRVINSSSGRINITHTFNLQNNEIYELPYDSSHGNSIGFTSTGFRSQAIIANYSLRKGETVEISCTSI